MDEAQPISGRPDDTCRRRITQTPLISEDDHAYNAYIESMRRQQYPMLKNFLYLDHAGTTLPSKDLLDAVHTDLLSNLYGNPHSASFASVQRIHAAREQLLKFFNADAETYDVVFTANATAAIKLVGEALRDAPEGFSYAYHVNSHTSIIGLREVASQTRCLSSQAEVDEWMNTTHVGTILYAYPAQSNMDGSRLSLTWCKQAQQRGIYIMLDAAAYASTTPLDIKAVSPDFTTVSLYKIFGFPDMGALIVKKTSAHILQHRKYLGGGTVDAISAFDQWHVRKTVAVHEQLEDGTLPVHNIVALSSAIDTFDELFGSLERVSRHTMFLARRLARTMEDLRHANGRQVCQIYKEASRYHDASTQGPIIAFNLLDENGDWLNNAEVEKLASVNDIHLRVGSVCNPGGVATALHIRTTEQIQDNFKAGYRCGSSNELIDGRPVGIVRVSLGSMSTISDTDRFTKFLTDYFVSAAHTIKHVRTLPPRTSSTRQLQIESLTIYPIKSCAGWPVPYNKPWQVHQEGLAWDREWCIVRSGTGTVLSQKQFPRMALIRPEIDSAAGRLRIALVGTAEKLCVPLSMEESKHELTLRCCSASVCDDTVEAQSYTSIAITKALSDFLGVACTLARFPAATAGQRSSRHSKDHLKMGLNGMSRQQPLLLSNESPILITTRSSLDAVNEVLKARGKRAAHHAMFRANITLAELPSQPPGAGQPWNEDDWQELQVIKSNDTTGAHLLALGGCRRCQMVCVDQLTGEKRPEIFQTLAKQRRIDGRVLFGIHCALHGDRTQTIRVGSLVHVS